MLPGFRFLFAAIVLSTSILVFGLGAAALLRATHEQYVSAPSWRNGPREQVFAQTSEPAQPVLAVLRAEPDMAEPAPNLRDQVPTIGLPASEPDQVAALTTEADAQPQVTEAPADASSAEPAKTEASRTEATATDATVEAAAPSDTLTPADTTASIEAKPAATTSEPAPAGADAALASAALDVATAKLAALNAPATTTAKDAPPKAKADSSKADDKAAKKAKAKKRHRVVRRPPPQQLQQQLDPFGQPQTFATTARTR
ncbi:hypothetical protein [Bradyrhizobium stylosanthis]|uniref:Uncharacterized protein n=1 Tax=Bradyrhizobium stylosanthis TaxID=1803665 RepID=A0A560DNA1_9BRAD|nr:hypothetical protein [Bradyrhizobium stylosanthis]TWA98586.1 hypothetical protein FBZ96_105264 [Bradyrhizobium stylosanthis]